MSSPCSPAPRVSAAVSMIPRALPQEFVVSAAPREYDLSRRQIGDSLLRWVVVKHNKGPPCAAVPQIVALERKRAFAQEVGGVLVPGDTLAGSRAWRESAYTVWRSWYAVRNCDDRGCCLPADLRPLGGWASVGRFLRTGA